MSAKYLPYIIAGAVALIIIFGLSFGHDVRSYLDYLAMLFFGHHAVKGNQAAVADDDDDAPETPAVTPKAVQVAPAVQTVAYTPAQKVAGVKMKVTQYGYKNDPDGDTLTEQGWGFRNNRLNASSCALTVAAQKALGAKAFDRIQIKFADDLILYRHFDDRAPENEARLDLYQPAGFDKTLPDVGEVSLCKSAVNLTA